MNAVTLQAVHFSGIVNFTSPNMKSPSILLSIVAAVSMTFGISTSTVHAQVCAGDVNGDHVVDGRDLAVVLGNWGNCSGPTWATVLEWEPNPAVVTDANLRGAIAASGFAWRVRDNASNIEMLLVPARTFTMGCSPGDAECSGDESPAHEVTLTNAFYMGKTEVTQAEWQAKMGSNPSFFFWNGASNPVEMVSWSMIQGFNAVTDLRLPTEAEWEYACRAGTTSAQYGSVEGVAWYSNAGWRTHPVAQKSPNSLGLYDTLGNVWEWCEDWYGEYDSGSVTNPIGPKTGSHRILRGGSWNNESSYSRASSRWHTHDHADSPFGFRVAKNP